MVSWDAQIIDTERKPATREGLAGAFSLPNRSIILLCLMPIGVMLVEGAFIDWSAVFVQSVLHGGPIAMGLIYSAFSLVMTVVRMSGDWLIMRYTAIKVARISAVSATIGIILFALAPNIPVAFVGALFSQNMIVRMVNLRPLPVTREVFTSTWDGIISGASK